MPFIHGEDCELLMLLESHVSTVSIEVLLEVTRKVDDVASGKELKSVIEEDEGEVELESSKSVSVYLILPPCL